MNAELASFRVMELCPGVYVCSPEVSLLYMAQKLSLDSLVLLGYELCGRYVLDPMIDKGFGTRPALCSVAQISEVAKVRRARGARALRKAAKRIVEGSYSKRESVLSMCLGYAPAWGGYRFSGYELNSELRLSERAARIYGKDSCRGDMVFAQERVIVEYDSDSEHTSAAARGKDARRVAALAMDGYHVISVTKPQLESTEQLDAVAEVLSMRLNREMPRVRIADYEDRKDALRKSLLTRRDWYVY